MCIRDRCNALCDLETMYQYQIFASIFATFVMTLIDIYFAVYGIVKLYVVHTRLEIILWIVNSVSRLVNLILVAGSTEYEVSMILYCWRFK